MAKVTLSLLVPLLAGIAFAGDLRVVDAVQKGNRTAVQGLVKQHADVNAAQVDGTTAIQLAAQQNDVDTVELLIRAGANVKAANRYGVTAMNLACINGNAAMIEKLLKAGADVNTSLPEGETALMTAARTGNLAAVRLLLGRDANVNAKEGWHGETALMWAVAENHPDVAKALLERGADVHAKSEVAGVTPSNEALLPSTYLPTGGFTALMFAVRAGHIDCVKLLLDAGANASEALPNGTSALVTAVTNAHYEVATLLLDRGADANADGQGWTALHQLVWARDPNHHFNLPPPVQTGRVDSLELVKALIAHGANVNARTTREPRDGYRNWMNRIGSTPYILAAKAADPTLMRLLIAHGADPRLEAKDHTTALMAAAGVGFWPAESPGTEAEAFEAVKLAAELGGDVNTINDGGYTALHGAAVRGANSIVQFLFDKGAKLDVKTKKEGWMPVTIADGVLIANTYKSTPHTAVLLRKLMSQK